MTKQNFTIRKHASISSSRIIHELWEGYSEAHEESAEKCIQEQRCFTQEQFLAAMTDQDYIKFILFMKHGGKRRAIGMIGGSNVLEKAAAIAYANPARLRAVEPEAASDGRLWYWPLLFVRKDQQGKDCARLMFREFTRFCIERDIVFASDYASDKHPRFLELMNKTVGEAATEIDPSLSLKHDVLGGQVYFITRFKR